METDLRLAHPMPQDAGFGDRLAGPRWVLALCFATIVFDGYDLIVYGSVVPKLLAYKAWGLLPSRSGRWEAPRSPACSSAR